MQVKRFPESVVSTLEKSKILGIRAGKGLHRFTGVWVVVVKKRVFVRSWDDRHGGWYQTFLKERQGVISIDGKEFPVRARKIRSESLLDQVDRAYAEKYHTPASRRYVRGLRLDHRRRTTTEFVPL